MPLNVIKGCHFFISPGSGVSFLFEFRFAVIRLKLEPQTLAAGFEARRERRERFGGVTKALINYPIVRTNLCLNT